MYYEISLAMKPGTHLNTKQKNHPFFSEAPRVGAKIVRHNHPIRLSEREMELNKLALKRLFDAQAINITELEMDENGKVARRTDVRKEMEKAVRKEMEKAKKVVPETKKATSPAKTEPVKTEPVKATPPPSEPPKAPEAVTEIAPPQDQPTTPAPTSSTKKNRKG